MDKVKVRVIVSNSSTINNSSNVAKGHKHLSFIANYFKSNTSKKTELPISRLRNGCA